MPPKPKYTKQEIIDAAFSLAREEGMDAVVARAVGARLGTSASPIFTVFNNMEELKEQVLIQAADYLSARMEGLLDYTPAFKEFGMRWTRFAMEEPKLYQLLYRNGFSDIGLEAHFMERFGNVFPALLGEIQATFGISEEDAKSLLNQLLIYSNGIATFSQNKTNPFNEQEISSMLSQVCIGLAISAQLRDGSFVEPRAKAMAQAALAGVMPRKKD